MMPGYKALLPMKQTARSAGIPGLVVRNQPERKAGHKKSRNRGEKVKSESWKKRIAQQVDPSAEEANA